MTDIADSMVVGGGYFGSIGSLDNDLVIEDKLFVEEFDSSMSDTVLVGGSVVGVGGLYFNKSVSDANNNELSFFTEASDQVVIGYGSSVSDRLLNINAKSYVQLNPLSTVNGVYINETGDVGVGHADPQSLLHVQNSAAVVNLKIEAEAAGIGDAVIKFEGAQNGLVGISQYLENQMSISDGEDPAIVGSDLSIDDNGAIDIGYDVIDTDSAQATHDVKVDVLGKLNATNVKVGGSVLTHMPEGSIVMWSGWTDELPDGWLLCTGQPGEGTTDQCNFVDYFIVGKEAGDTVNESVGAASHSIATSSDYEHQHVSSHGHGAFTETGHNHANVNVDSQDAHDWTHADAHNHYSLQWNETRHPPTHLQYHPLPFQQ
jgi:hypothetical protein